jgi:acetyl esterase/lipase
MIQILKTMAYGIIFIALFLSHVGAKDCNERLGPYDVNFTLDDQIASMVEMNKDFIRGASTEGIPYITYLGLLQKPRSTLGIGGFWIEHYIVPWKMDIDILNKTVPAQFISMTTAKACNIVNQSIDGHEGIVVDYCNNFAGRTSHTYRFSYWLDNQTCVNGAQNFGDWERGMLPFLNSLHVLSSVVNTNQFNATGEDKNLSRLYNDRSVFETNLVQHIPAPQRYTNELPPIGAKEITYNSGNLSLKAWLSDKPADDEKHPAVVYAHGGFALGGSDWADAQEFINQGFVLMMPALRGENGNPGNFEFFYGEIDDLIAAADYLTNVSYVDRDRIFLCGHSVGGTLSMLTSMMPSNYRAHASYGGSPDQESFFKYGQFTIPFDSKNPREIELRSPIEYPDSILKPLFIYVGDQDLAYLDLSKYLAGYAKVIGKPCEINVVEGDHFTSVSESIRLTINEFRNIKAYETLASNISSTQLGVE